MFFDINGSSTNSIIVNNFSSDSIVNRNKIDLKDDDSKVKVNQKDIKVKQIDDFLHLANTKLESEHTNLKFIKHEKLNEFYIQVIDNKNNIIQEIPNKKELDFFAAFMEFNQLIDKRI